MDKEKKLRKKVVVEEVVEQAVAESHKEEGFKSPREDTKSVVPPTNEAASTESAQTNEESAVPPTPPPKFNFLWIIVPGLLILLALAGGVFVYEQGVSSQKAKLIQTPELASTEAPSASPSATPQVLDLTKHPIAILNGSGIAGEGARAKDLIESGGFKVASVDNAQTFDFTKTKIQAKQTVQKDFLSQLQKTLGKNYVVDTTVAILSYGQKEDVIVTIGNTKSQ